MTKYHIYDASTGLFLGRTYEGSEKNLLSNTPSGCAAVVGVTDWMSQKVDPKTGTVIDWQPPAPPADESQSWRWDATARRWWPVPTSKALATAARAERARLLAACDWVPLRAVELGQAVPSAWAAYRKALREVPAQIGFPHAVDWPVPP